MRYFKLISGITLFFILGTSCNVKKGLTLAPETTADTLAHALLWQIDKAGLDAPSYLYGTIHIINSDDFFWPNGTLAAFDESQQVIFEIDLNILNNMGAIMDIRDRMFMEGDTTLKMLYRDEDYVEIKDYFSSQGVPMAFMERIKPLFLSSMVGVDMSGGQLGESDKIKSYEMELQNMAKTSVNKDGSEKEIKGLETIEMQMDKIDKVPLSAQAEMLLAAIKAEKEGDNQMEMLSKMYVSQNINIMVDEIASSQDMGDYSSVLLDERNRSWIPIIDSLVHEKPSFIAVGAAHLGGEQGVIRLLQKEGYSLTPLSAVENKKNTNGEKSP